MDSNFTLGSNDPYLSSKKVFRMVTILKAISNERRLQILFALMDHERCVSDLEKMLGLSQSALSQHLAKLRSCHLVCTRREAQTIYYKIGQPAVVDLISSLDKMIYRSFDEQKIKTE